MSRAKAETAELHTVLSNNTVLACGMEYQSGMNISYYEQRQHTYCLAPAL